MYTRLSSVLLAAGGLAAAAAAQTLDAFGISNSSLQNAALAYDPLSRQLTVSNIGSSGEDGVRITPGDTYAMDFAWGDTVANAPSGSHVEMRVSLNGLPPGTRYLYSTVAHGDAGWSVTGSALGLGVAGFSWYVLDNGQLTGRVPVANGDVALLSAGPVGGSAGPQCGPIGGGGPGGTHCDPWETVQWYCTSNGGNSCGASWVVPSFSLSNCCAGVGGSVVATCGIPSFATWNFGATVAVSMGGTTAFGDTLMLVADVTGDVATLSYVDVVGGGLGSLTFSAQKLEFSHRPNETLGASTVDIAHGAVGDRRLVVANIGSSGQDGVSIDLGQAESAAVVLDPIDPAAAIDAYFDIEFAGTRNGVPDQPIGSLGYRRRPAFFDVFADFGDIGSITHHTTVLAGGGIVADFPGQAGQVGSASAWPTGVARLGGSTQGFSATSPAGTQFFVAGGVYVGDELRVLAEGATAAVGAKSQLRLRCASTGPVTLLEEHVEPTDVPSGSAFCSGDGSATACPCGNSGGTGRGCANSVDATGALLQASGVAQITADSLLLSGSGMPNGSVLYFQGTAMTNGGMGTTFGDGLRCASGAVIRLGTKTNVMGTSAYPGGLDQPISVKGQITAPGTRYYQAWYRNATPFCTPAGFNLSNGAQVDWAM